jgi:3-mercaptopyruvate sulfurtransferase SseA
MKRIVNWLTVIVALTFALQACSATTPTIASTHTPIAGEAGTQAALPRVSIEEARSALESGAAILVDVRSVESYKASHIAGAISIPLNEIEAGPDQLNLDKTQWIITYCT